MFGYILAFVLGLLVLSLLLVGLVKTSPRSGQLPGKRPVQASAPAADEVTPDRSSTAKPTEIRLAREHTPPA